MARKSSSNQDFWSRMLSASKVRRVLERRGFSPEAFVKDYLEDHSRAPRGLRRPEKREIDAVAQYHRDWDINGLMARLRVKTKTSALTTVDRVMRWQARTGTKKARPTPK